jgi:hypothetical protein
VILTFPAGCRIFPTISPLELSGAETEVANHVARGFVEAVVEGAEYWRLNGVRKVETVVT